MMNKIYPRKGDTQTVYLNAVVAPQHHPNKVFTATGPENRQSRH